MSKQDRQAVRTAAELERRLGGGKTSSESSKLETLVRQINQSLQQFIVNTNARFEEIESVEVVDTVEKDNMSAVTSNAVALEFAKIIFRIEQLENGVVTLDSAILDSARLDYMELG